jgi:hypothetical protein
MKRSLIAACILCATGPAQAAFTPAAIVTGLDSLGPTTTYVSLANFSDPQCDQNRILIEHPDAAYAQKMFSMLMLAFATGALVRIDYTVSLGQCRGARVLIGSNN